MHVNNWLEFSGGIVFIVIPFVSFLRKYKATANRAHPLMMSLAYVSFGFCLILVSMPMPGAWAIPLVVSLAVASTICGVVGASSK
jgi:hypothetical protein